MFLARPTSHSLGAHVEKGWYCAGYSAEHAKERVLPNGRFQIVIDLKDNSLAAPPLVVGMQTKCAVIETQGLHSMIGVLFRPGGANALLKLPADEFRDRVVSLDAVWGSGVLGLRGRLMEAGSPREKFQVLEAALLERARTGRPLHEAVE